MVLILTNERFLHMRNLLLLLFSSVLFGCLPNKEISVTSICEDNPELCADLHKISDCRYIRTDVIRARYYYKTEPSGSKKRDLLTQLDRYGSCLELRLTMQLTRHVDRKKQRLENYLTTQQSIKTLLKESEGTQDPVLAYYLWINNHDLHAKQVFIKAATAKGMKDPDILAKLASAYSKTMPTEGLKYFFKAMRSSKSIEEFPKTTFLNVMALYFKKRDFENAYIWAYINKEADFFEGFPVDFDLILQKGTPKGIKKINNEDQLEEIAEKYYQQLKNGTFEAFP